MKKKEENSILCIYNNRMTYNTIIYILQHYRSHQHGNARYLTSTKQTLHDTFPIRYHHSRQNEPILVVCSVVFLNNVRQYESITTENPYSTPDQEAFQTRIITLENQRDVSMGIPLREGIASIWFATGFLLPFITTHNKIIIIKKI